MMRINVNAFCGDTLPTFGRTAPFDSWIPKIRSDKLNEDRR